MRVVSLIERLESRQLLATSHFAVIGDFGTDTQGEADVAALVKSWNPDYIVTVGDNSYPDANPSVIDKNIGKYYHDYIYNYTGSYGAGSPTRRFYPALGNHDWGNVVPGDASSYLSYFDLPGNERYYDFTAGPVHFFIIDSDLSEPDGTTPSSVQGQWLKNKLAAATEPHKVVVMHHPAYNSGGAHGSESRMRWPFAKWGATTVFAGHEHIYERLNEEGIPFFTNGLGGQTVSNTGTAIAGSQIQYNANVGAMLVDATDTTMQFRFYTRSGALIDNYTLNLAGKYDLIKPGSTWKFQDDGSNQGTAWRASSFVDSGWTSGEAQLGYGDGDEATNVSFGSNSNAKYITTYFRKSFDVPDKSYITGLNLSMLRDDGAVVYLNGTQVFSSNMPGGTITSSTLASTAVGGSPEGEWFSGTIDPALLVNGTNVIAVEVHQSGGTSSDLGFDLSLQAVGDFSAPVASNPSFTYTTAPPAVNVDFNKTVSPSISSANLVLQNITTSTTITAGNIHLDWIAATKTARFTFPTLGNAALPNGRYRATLSPTGVMDVWGIAMTQPLSFDFFWVNGDANHDGNVDVADFKVVTATYMQPTSGGYPGGDFNYDGVINQIDLDILSANWGYALPPAPLSAQPVVSSPTTPPSPTTTRSKKDRLITSIVG
jgi:hypothetical protein